MREEILENSGGERRHIDRQRNRKRTNKDSCALGQGLGLLTLRRTLFLRLLYLSLNMKKMKKKSHVLQKLYSMVGNSDTHLSFHISMS